MASPDSLFHNADHCPVCGTRGLVLTTEPLEHCRHRIRRCPQCQYKWDGYETDVDPDDLTDLLSRYGRRRR